MDGEVSKIQRYAISGALASYWIGSAIVTYRWVFFTQHNTMMDKQVAFGLSMFITMGWTLPVFVNYALKTMDDSAQNEPTVNSPKVLNRCAVKLTLPYVR